MSVRAIKDANLISTMALSNGAGAVVSPAVAVGPGPRGDLLQGMDLLLSAPALSTTLLPDTETMTYDVETSLDSAFTSPIVIYPGFLVQTGAGGTGAAAATKRCALPSDAPEFVRFKATKTGTGNASTVSATLQPHF